MKTRELMAAMWLGLVVVAVTLGLVTAGVIYDNRQLRQEGRELRTALDLKGTEALDLKAERTTIAEELRAQRQRVEELSLQLAELKSAADAKGAAVGQQAYRVRAYLGNELISQGWLVAGRGATNGNGEIMPEPVVVLDPAARTRLAAAPPAEPAGVQPTSVTVNHNYPYTYGGVWPAIWVSGTDHKRHKPPTTPEEPRRFLQPPKPQPPTSPFLSTRIWQPQRGFQQLPQARPGGEWVSAAPRGHSYISSGGGGGITGGSGMGTFPARY